MNAKHACLIFVAASKHLVDRSTTELSDLGYNVCAVEATPQDAENAKLSLDIPKELLDCIKGAEICIILLPEEDNADCGLGAVCAVCERMGKAVVGRVAGNRANYPQQFDDFAQSMIREKSDLAQAIAAKTWERPDATPAPPRDGDYVKCQ